MRIISIDGGGHLGLTSASFLQSVEKRFDTRCADRFDLFCGTSTGAIIALALASGKSAAEVVVLYEQLGTKVFKNPTAMEVRFPKTHLQNHPDCSLAITVSNAVANRRSRCQVRPPTSSRHVPAS